MFFFFGCLAAFNALSPPQHSACTTGFGGGGFKRRKKKRRRPPQNHQKDQKERGGRLCFFGFEFDLAGKKNQTAVVKKIWLMPWKVDFPAFRRNFLCDTLTQMSDMEEEGGKKWLLLICPKMGGERGGSPNGTGATQKELSHPFPLQHPSEK